MDPAIWVAVLGLGGVIITGAVAVVVALITNGRERTNAAEGTLEKTLRERIALRDEQINELRDDNAELKAENLELREKYQAARRENQQLKAGTTP